VGERGATLSGGQRQRLSIARTVLIDPPVLILDDSTSSVDVETERMIHQAMTDVMKGRTTFIIAHRLSSVREADHIIVLKDGEIAEQGSHAELMAVGGTYREIYDLQLRPQEEVLLDAAISGDDGGDS
jgi:ABC-type multidrug transport system fused ATPase/permease subunit